MFFRNFGAQAGVRQDGHIACLQATLVNRAKPRTSR
jgi:hypothetical protein